MRQNENTGFRAIYVVRGLLLAMTLAACVFIFLNSGANGQKSDAESLRVTETIAEIAVKDYRDMPKEQQTEVLTQMHGIVRRAAHFSEFALLGFLCVMSLLSWEESFAPAFRRHWYRYLAAFGFCVLYAVGDEIHQLFVEARACQLSDVGMDSAGAFCGICFALLVGWLISRLTAHFRRKREAPSDKNTNFCT